MTTNRFDELANFLKHLKDGQFDMSMTLDPDPERECGTVMCMGGAAAILQHPDLTDYDIWEDYGVLKQGRKFLGLTGVQAAKLFDPEYVYNSDQVCNPEITLDHALQALENTKLTGDPQWGKVLDLPNLEQVMPDEDLHDYNS